MYTEENGKIWLATGSERVYLNPAMANRHGLIAGATGTGKTVTLKVVAESFSEMGVPVFIADIKGDVSGMCLPGAENKHIRRRIIGFLFRFGDMPLEIHVPELQVLNISLQLGIVFPRLLGLNDTQSGVLRIVFRIADDNGMLLLDLKDLRAMLQFVADNANDYKIRYGNVSPQSIGAIQRALLTLEDEGGNLFFGEPALDIADWFDWAADGRGVMNILECAELFQHPLLYGTFLLWMLSELYELLPEAGDLDKPKIAFFFDEAHLLFKDAPKALLEKVEQVVRLIRSKGVSVWFITQNPMDIPESVLAQIGNRVQHALRAYTPNEQKAIRAAARSFRVNEAFDTETVLQELATGEALVSVLDEKGIPSIVERANILPPKSSMNAVEPAVIGTVLATSPLLQKYAAALDRESAYEILTAKAEEAAKEAEEAARLKEEEKQRLAAEKQRLAEEKAKAAEERRIAAELKAKEREQAQKKAATRKTTSVMEKAASSAMNTIGREVGRQLIRGLFGTLKK